MMWNFDHSGPIRSKAIHWKPHDWTTLAVATDDGATLRIEIVHWEGEGFKKRNRIEVPTNHKLESICWESTGKYLLATLEPPDVGTRPQMAVIKYPTRVDCMKSIVDTGYKGSYSAVFRPCYDQIITCAPELRSIWVWEETESNVWATTARIKIGEALTKMSFNKFGTLLAGIGEKLKIWKWEADKQGGQSVVKLRSRKVQQEDNNHVGWRGPGISLKDHCTNLSSVYFCSNDMVLTGSSKGSMCLHRANPKQIKNYRVQAFQHCYVQFMYPQGEIACVKEVSKNGQRWLAAGGSDGIASMWEYWPGQNRPTIDRNPRLEQYWYEPKFKSLDASVSMDRDDAESVLSVSTDKNDDLETLLKVKAEIASLKMKQNDLQKVLKEADDGMATGQKMLKEAEDGLKEALDSIRNAAKGVRSAKAQQDAIKSSLDCAKAENDAINSSLDSIIEVLNFEL